MWVMTLITTLYLNIVWYVLVLSRQQVYSQHEQCHACLNQLFLWAVTLSEDDCIGFQAGVCSMGFQQPFSTCVQRAILQSVFRCRCAVTHSAFCEYLLWSSVYKRCTQEHVLGECAEKLFPFLLPLIISKLGCMQGIATPLLLGAPSPLKELCTGETNTHIYACSHSLYV